MYRLRGITMTKKELIEKALKDLKELGANEQILELLPTILETTYEYGIVDGMKIADKLFRKLPESN